MAPRSPLTFLGKCLRKQPTDAERRLWVHVRRRQLLGVRFRRQVPIGEYSADFCCLEPKMIIEVDGGQHQRQKAADTVRTECLQRSGYRVLRFWNNDVLQNLTGVLECIEAELTALRNRDANSSS